MITRLPEFIEKPRRVFVNRKAWCAIAEHRRSGDVFNDVFGFTDIVQKLARRHLIDEAMGVAMAGNLMSLVQYLSEQLREMFACPAQKKTGDILLL